MNQEQNDELQKAINEVTQNAVNATAQPDQPASIVPERNMAGQNNDAVADAMASVLPNATTSEPTPPVVDNATAPVEPATTSATTDLSATDAMSSDDLAQVKEQALRELSPVLAKTDLNPEEKFKIYKDMIETLHDNSLFMPALDAAKQIADEKLRADSLLGLVNLIDATENN